MTFKEKIEALKGRVKAKITKDLKAEEIEAYNSFISELDSLDGEHSKSLEEQAKLKDTIVRMVLTQGNNETPKDDSTPSKGMDINEVLAQVEKEKGGK